MCVCLWVGGSVNLQHPAFWGCPGTSQPHQRQCSGYRWGHPTGGDKSHSNSQCLAIGGRKTQEGRTGHLSQFGVVDEVGSVSVDEGAQSQAVLPTERPEEERGEGGKIGERKEDEEEKGEKEAKERV